MSAAVLGELVVRILALVLTAYFAHFYATRYITALTDAGRAYLTIVDLLYARERLPLRV